MYKDICTIATVLLRDGTFLRAVIFDDNNPKERSIQDEAIIRQKFTEDKLIAFQTANINGHFHPINVLWYDIIFEEF